VSEGWKIGLSKPVWTGNDCLKAASKAMAGSEENVLAAEEGKRPPAEPMQVEEFIDKPGGLPGFSGNHNIRCGMEQS